MFSFNTMRYTSAKLTTDRIARSLVQHLISTYLLLKTDLAVTWTEQVLTVLRNPQLPVDLKVLVNAAENADALQLDKFTRLYVDRRVGSCKDVSMITKTLLQDIREFSTQLERLSLLDEFLVKLHHQHPLATGLTIHVAQLFQQELQQHRHNESSLLVHVLMLVNAWRALDSKLSSYENAIIAVGATSPSIYSVLASFFTDYVCMEG
jgi:hypothetical protein